jgi:hypothetical protein
MTAEERHASNHAAIEQRLDGHDLQLGALHGEQALVRQRLIEGAKKFALIEPKPWGAWAKAGGLSLVIALISLIVFIAQLPTGDDLKSVRAGVLQDVTTARNAAQAVEVRQAELSGDLKVIQAAQVRQEASQRDVAEKLDELLIRRAPGNGVH